MKEQRRGKQIALTGLVLQVLVVVVLMVLWRMTLSAAILAGLWVPLGGLALAVMTSLLFYVRQLEAQETLELSALGESGREGLFNGQERLELRPASRRLAMVTKWVIPIFTLLLALYQCVLALVMVGYLRANPTMTLIEDDAPRSLLSENAPAAAMFLLIAAFVSFLFSRYCTGMGSVDLFRPLRSIGSYFLLSALFLFALGVSMIFVSQDAPMITRPVTWVLLAVQMLLGLEMLLNLVLEFYRPRRAGEVYAPAYESRILNLIAEPQRLGSSIADTLNYQFGFEVSTTWFYKLIARAILPLIAFGIGMFLLLSSIVIVREGETFVVKHFGKIKDTLTAGVHTKWPWPVDTIERFDTGRVEQVILGVEGDIEIQKTASNNELLLWSEEHGFGNKKERNFLIAVPYRDVQELGDNARAKSPSNVAVIKLVVMLRYRIVDPIQYLHLATDPKRLIESIAKEEMVGYCARATLSEKLDDDTDRPQGIMTFGREPASKALQARIEKRLGEQGMNLGVKLELVKIVSAHPPARVVPEFEKVLEAERRQDLLRYEARGKASAALASVSGDPDQAMRVYLLLRKVQILETLQNVRSDATKYTRQFRSAVTTLKSEISSLGKELERERLLGTRLVEQETQPDGTVKETVHPQLRLQRAYQAFLAELKAEANAKTDFAPQIATLRTKAIAEIYRLDGKPAADLAAAQATRWASQMRSMVALESMRQKFMSYSAAPDVYAFDQRMDVLEAVLPGMTKYVMGLDPKRLQVWLNLHRDRDALSEGLEEAASGEQY